MTPEDVKNLAEIRERFRYQEAERFVTGYEEDIRFLLNLVPAPSDNMTGKRIPIAAAQRIAEQYNYDQVVIIARKVGEGGNEHVTTYGIDKANCDVAARIGHFIKHKIMGWPEAA